MANLSIRILNLGPINLKAFFENSDNQRNFPEACQFAEKLYFKATPSEREDGQFYVNHKSYVSIAAATGQSWEVLEAAWEKDGQDNEVWKSRDDLEEIGCVNRHTREPHTLLNVYSPIDYLIANGDVASLRKLDEKGIKISNLSARSNNGEDHWQGLKASGVKLRPSLIEKFDSSEDLAIGLRNSFLGRIGPLKLALLSGNSSMIQFVVEHNDPMLGSLFHQDDLQLLVSQLAMCDIDANWFWKEVLKGPATVGVRVDSDRAKMALYVLDRIYPLYLAECGSDKAELYLKTQIVLTEKEKNILDAAYREGWALPHLDALEDLRPGHLSISLGRILNMDPNVVKTHIVDSSQDEILTLVCEFWANSPRRFYKIKDLDNLEISQSGPLPGAAFPRYYIERRGVQYQISPFSNQFLAPLDEENTQRAVQAMALFGGDHSKFLPQQNQYLFLVKEIRMQYGLPIDQALSVKASENIYNFLSHAGLEENGLSGHLMTHAFSHTSEFMSFSNKLRIQELTLKGLLDKSLTFGFFQSLKIEDKSLTRAIRSNKWTDEERHKLSHFFVLRAAYQHVQSGTAEGSPTCSITSEGLMITAVPSEDGGENFDPFASIELNISLLDSEFNPMPDTDLIQRAIELIGQDEMSFEDYLNPYFKGLANRQQLESISFEGVEASIRGSQFLQRAPELTKVVYRAGVLDDLTLAGIEIDSDEIDAMSEKYEVDLRNWQSAQAMIKAYQSIEGNSHAAKMAVDGLVNKAYQSIEGNSHAAKMAVDGLVGGGPHQRKYSELPRVLRNNLTSKEKGVDAIFSHFKAPKEQPNTFDRDAVIKAAKLERFFEPEERSVFKGFDFVTCEDPVPLTQELMDKSGDELIKLIQDAQGDFLTECEQRIFNVPESLFSNVKTVKHAIEVFGRGHNFMSWLDRQHSGLTTEDKFQALLHLSTIERLKISPNIKAMFESVMKNCTDIQCIKLTQNISKEHVFSTLYRETVKDSYEGSSLELSIALFRNNHLISQQSQVNLLKAHKAFLPDLKTLEVTEVHHLSWVSEVWGDTYVKDLRPGSYEGLMMYELLRSSEASSTANVFIALAEKTQGFSPSETLWRALAKNHHGLFVRFMQQGNNIQQIYKDPQLLDTFLESSPSKQHQGQLINLCLDDSQAIKVIEKLEPHDVTFVMDDCLRKHRFETFNVLWARGFKDFSKNEVDALVMRPLPGHIDAGAYKKTMRSILFNYFLKAHGKTYFGFSMLTVGAGIGIGFMAANFVPALLLSGFSQCVFGMWMYNDVIMHELMVPKIKSDGVKSSREIASLGLNSSEEMRQDSHGDDSLTPAFLPGYRLGGE
jgi:hypothetical protein